MSTHVMPGLADSQAPTQSSHLDGIYANALLDRAQDTALVDPQGRALTYAELDQQIQASARWLSANGITQGDRVAVWLINQPQWLVLLFALARLGATLVAVNTRFRSHELQYLLSRSQASMLIMQPGFHKLDFPAIIAGVDPAELPDLRTVVVLPGNEQDRTDGHMADSQPHRILDRPVIAYLPHEAPAEHGDPSIPVAERSDLPVILFTTSGTTKGPKLVVHTQRTLSGHAYNVQRAFGMGAPGDSLLAALPFCGVFGLNSVLGAIAAAQPVYMLDVFNAPDTIAALLEHRITHFFATDEMLRRLALDWPEGRRAALKLVGFAAFSPGAEDLAQEMGRLGFPLTGVYGSSEVMALFSYQKLELPMTERTLGGGTPASPAAQVRIRNPESGQLCATGEAGEIEIAAPTNFVGYLNNPEATSAAIMADGFFRTGDLGYLRGDGSFVYLSRMGDAMRLGGFLVNPTEIEYAITLFDGISDAQVVAVDMAGKMRPVAFVIGQSHAPAERDMIDSLNQTMAPFKVPARIWFVDEFPTTASANGLKFQRVKLRDMAIERLASDKA